MFIDLDNFKKLNDTLGHHAGDDALKKVGEIIRTSIRKSDIAGRFGGDEFMVCLHTDDINDAIGIGEKILSAIREDRSQLESRECELSASIGIAYTSNTNTSYNSLLKLAEEASYKAKNEGKGNVRLREPD